MDGPNTSANRPSPRRRQKSSCHSRSRAALNPCIRKTSYRVEAYMCGTPQRSIKISAGPSRPGSTYSASAVTPPIPSTTERRTCRGSRRATQSGLGVFGMLGLPLVEWVRGLPPVHVLADRLEDDAAVAGDVLQESFEHEHAVTAADHLRVHRQRV